MVFYSKFALIPGVFSILSLLLYDGQRLRSPLHDTTLADSSSLFRGLVFYNNEPRGLVGGFLSLSGHFLGMGGSLLLYFCVFGKNDQLDILGLHFSRSFFEGPCARAFYSD